MLQIGALFHNMEAAPFEERVQKAREKGFTCVQLALRKAELGFPIESENLTPGTAMYLKKVFEKNQVEVGVLGCYLHITTPDEKEYQDALKYYKANIRLAAHLGCGVVGTETGSLRLDNRYTPESDSEEAFDFFIQRFRPIVDYAEKMGVSIGVEPVWCHVINSVERARKMLDVIDSPNLRIILDITNLLSPKNYTKQDEIMEQAFEILGDDIAVLHIKDFVLKDNEPLTVLDPIGTGKLNIRKFLKLYKEKKPFAHMIIDGFSPETVEDSIKTIQKVYEEV